MKKRYEMYGFVECIIAKRVKNKVLTAHFEGGNINRNMPMPATFTTKDKELQQLVENSKEYKQGVITLAYTEEATTEEAVQKVEGVESLQSARAYLGKQGVTLDRLQTKKDILSVAKELGIEFPNIK